MNNPKRRFRPRQQKNGFKRRSNSGQVSHFSNNNGKSFSRNGSMNNPFAVEKAIQKYQQLAKDALSAGDNLNPAWCCLPSKPHIIPDFLLSTINTSYPF